MIKIKYENSWYGYQGRDGFALYIDGKKANIGLFISVAALRDHWNKYRVLLCAGYVRQSDGRFTKLSTTNPY